jgi:hypothetical protein
MSHTKATQKSRRALLIVLVTGWAGVLKGRPKAGAGWHRAATQITAGKGLVNNGAAGRRAAVVVGYIVYVAMYGHHGHHQGDARGTGEGAFCGWGCYP